MSSSHQSLWLVTEWFLEDKNTLLSLFPSFKTHLHSTSKQIKVKGRNEVIKKAESWEFETISSWEIVNLDNETLEEKKAKFSLNCRLLVKKKNKLDWLLKNNFGSVRCTTLVKIMLTLKLWKLFTHKIYIICVNDWQEGLNLSTIESNTKTSEQQDTNFERNRWCHSLY